MQPLTYMGRIQSFGYLKKGSKEKINRPKQDNISFIVHNQFVYEASFE